MVREDALVVRGGKKVYSKVELYYTEHDYIISK
jgi:hypothetical protein